MYETKEDTNLTFHTYTHNLEQVQLEIIQDRAKVVKNARVADNSTIESRVS